MEDMNLIISLVGSVGFPIVCCLMMWKQMLKQDENHKEELSKLNESINNNTKVMEKVLDKLENGSKESTN